MMWVVDFCDTCKYCLKHNCTLCVPIKVSYTNWLLQHDYGTCPIVKCLKLKVICLSWVSLLNETHFLYFTKINSEQKLSSWPINTCGCYYILTIITSELTCLFFSEHKFHFLYILVGFLAPYLTWLGNKIIILIDSVMLCELNYCFKLTRLVAGCWSFESQDSLSESGKSEIRNVGKSQANDR